MKTASYDHAQESCLSESVSEDTPNKNNPRSSAGIESKEIDPEEFRKLLPGILAAVEHLKRAKLITRQTLQREITL
jgi:hypothetical protein